MMSLNYRHIAISGSRELKVHDAHVRMLLGFGISSLVAMWGLSVFPTKHFTIHLGYNPETDQPKGVDRIAFNYFKNYDNVVCHPADWDGLGRGAGMIRNGEMFEPSHAGILIWNGWSTGTENMLSRFERSSKDYVLFRVPG